MQKPVAIIDIDGILTDYPQCFLDWVFEKYNLRFNSIDNMQDSMTIEKYNVIKFEYRSSGVKRNLPLKEGAENIIDFMEILESLGYDIWIVSTRPSMCREDTEAWLNQNGITYHHLRLVSNKRQYIKWLISKGHKIHVIIDDKIHELVV